MINSSNVCGLIKDEIDRPASERAGNLTPAQTRSSNNVWDRSLAPDISVPPNCKPSTWIREVAQRISMHIHRYLGAGELDI